MNNKIQEVADMATIFAGETMGTPAHNYFECITQALNEIIAGVYKEGDGKQYIANAFIAAEIDRQGDSCENV